MTGAPQPEGDALATVEVTTRAGANDGEWVVAIAGEIDVATSSLLHGDLASLVERRARRIVLDLHHMSFIDSSGLGVLVGTLRRLKEQEGEAIVLRGMQDPVRRVFEITGLTGLFRIED
jgi:anti-sigma B factor antagonist